MEPEYAPGERENGFTVICTSRGVALEVTSADSQSPESEVAIETLNGKPVTDDETVIAWLGGDAPPA